MTTRNRIPYHPHDAAFLKEIKKTIVVTSVGIIFGTIITFTAFYYNTKNTLEFHQKAIEKLQTDMDFLIQLHCKKE